MVEIVNYKGFDRKIFPSDWRFSAAAVGLFSFLDFYKKEHLIEKDALYYHQKDLKGREEYLLFAQEYFKEEMHHCIIENLLLKKELSEEEEKLLKEKMSANVVLKKVFKNMKFTGENGQEILGIIEKNRLEIIKETFKNAKYGYLKFANPKKLLNEEGKLCRLIGYYADLNRKSKSISYNFDFKTYEGKDSMLFDFIPFAFTKGVESAFVHSNLSMQRLIDINALLKEKMAEDMEKKRQRKKQKKKEEKEGSYIPRTDFREILFYGKNKEKPLLQSPAEIIIKERETKYYESLFLSQKAIETFRLLHQTELEAEESTKKEEKKEGDLLLKILTTPCKMHYGEYLPVLKIVTGHILNQTDLSPLIQSLLLEEDKVFLCRQLIRLNHILKEGESLMKSSSSKRAFAEAKKIAHKAKNMKQEKKLQNLRRKLLIYLSRRDYLKFEETVMLLSSEFQVSADFLFDFMDEMQKKKDPRLAYIFVNALEAFERKPSEEKEEEGETEK